MERTLEKVVSLPAFIGQMEGTTWNALYFLQSQRLSSEQQAVKTATGYQKRISPAGNLSKRGRSRPVLVSIPKRFAHRQLQ